jgi:hypothetical protein
MQQLIESKKVDLDASVLAENDAEKTLFKAQKKLEIAKVAVADECPKSNFGKHIGELVEKLKNYQPSM